MRECHQFAQGFPLSVVNVDSNAEGGVVGYAVSGGWTNLTTGTTRTVTNMSTGTHNKLTLK